jgi:ribonuclease Z
MLAQRYPLVWEKKKFYIKIFCSIPNIATGILIKAGKNLFAVDPGDGILRDLNNEIGTDKILSISDLFITHGHHDHVGGVWSLLTYMRVMNRKTPISLHYPKGCVEIESIHSAFIKVYSKTLPYKIILKEINKHAEFKSNNITVRPFPVIWRRYCIL